MNFDQMHERLRQELIRRIQRGTLSVSLLSHQTGLTQAHVSNFLNSKRRLSGGAVDLVLRAQHIEFEDLFASARRSGAPLTPNDETISVPIVSPSSALSEPIIHPSAVVAMMPLPPDTLRTMRSRAPSNRLAWQRFVAVRVSAAEARPMDPLILPEALVVIDRHYTSLLPYRTIRPAIYAVRNGAHLALRHVEFLAGSLILRSHNRFFPLETLENEPGRTTHNLIAGRVALVLNET
jgi:hypothetical protein